MQVNETLNEGLKRGYAITVTAAELEAKVNEKLAEAQPEVEMKGFRKGKVPMALLKKQFGQKVMGEAMQESIDGAMQEHFEKSGDRPAMQPDVKMANEDWKEGDDVEVTMTYEALPEIPEVDLSSITLEKMVVKADDAAVEEALANLAETAQDFEAREEGAKAEDGDQITFDFLGKVDGEAFEGGAAEDYPLVLGSNSFIPGFEEQLVGVVAGDEKDVTVSFPEDYQAPHLAGKEAVFECKVKEVKKPVAAKVDDELAKKFGAEDLAALKSQIAERLEAEYAGASRAVMKRGLLDELDKLVSFDLPPSLVEAEAGQIAHQLWHEDNPDVQGHDHPEIETTDEHKKLAERRVRLGLLLAELGQKAEVQVTDAEMTQAIMNQARQYPGQERQFFEFVQQNQQMQQQMRAPLFEDKVVDHVFEQATLNEKEVSKEDLQKAVEELEDE
ncbi:MULTISPECIES: trigger factor [Sulfitobacter]|jgi:trigger factor|uniref:trigger factor n=1 Tax=Sulfitobacter TaxID=60136 RepID=UPI0004E3EE42|nr:MULTISPECIES: trigger factor [Sulfitobacter]NKX48631.1 trigger factor [Rhodobacteraceae bacterium R_SAG8]HBM38897.1 trigger factor [Sulfitobacter sp.]OAN77507.1 trigger factor [Sulfitobacter pontiacus]PTA98746.1 trigger factor [Sulfitobacter sp. CB-A]QLL42484.1 trigger factor [Sulfitobacter pontiacus]|tara:strand:+ start:166 stop:1497 length:1332 start_codon:yes stop_codon:yes gene_type:complete